MLRDLYLPTLEQRAATATIVTVIIYCYVQQPAATTVLTATSNNLHPVFASISSTWYRYNQNIKWQNNSE